MTDRKFEILLITLNRSHGEYLRLLLQAEDEYFERFGNYPSEVDDDHWIDSFHTNCAGSTLKNVLKHGALANDRLNE